MSDHTAEPVADEIPQSEDEQSDAAADPILVGEKKKKKKKSKKSKGKKVVASSEIPSTSPELATGHKISSGMVQQILKANPSLAAETQGADPKMIQEMLGRLTVEEMLTGMVSSRNLRWQI